MNFSDFLGIFASIFHFFKAATFPDNSRKLQFPQYAVFTAYGDVTSDDKACLGDPMATIDIRDVDFTGTKKLRHFDIKSDKKAGENPWIYKDSWISKCYNFEKPMKCWTLSRPIDSEIVRQMDRKGVKLDLDVVRRVADAAIEMRPNFGTRRTVEEHLDRNACNVGMWYGRDCDSAPGFPWYLAEAGEGMWETYRRTASAAEMSRNSHAVDPYDWKTGRANRTMQSVRVQCPKRQTRL